MLHFPASGGHELFHIHLIKTDEKMCFRAFTSADHDT